ncbi:MAG: hypothetical protein MI867_00995 [Pseudomonadales bacterium]|nr:hypothetical protein [Pseudomonadales bacterium]
MTSARTVAAVFVSVLAAIVTVDVSAVLAAPLARSAELRVNAESAGFQQRPAVAASSAGDFVVVWNHSPDGAAAPAVRARRFAASGVAIGSELQVSETAAHARPDVVVTESGRFLVVWKQRESGQSRIMARRYQSDGAAAGTAFRVDVDPGYPCCEPDDKHAPRVMTSPDASFVVAWSSSAYVDSDYFEGYSYRVGTVFGRRVSSDGAPVGAELVLSDSGSGYTERELPDLAAGTQGEFVVVWSDSSFYFTTLSTYTYGYVRRFGATGSPTTAGARVSNGYQVSPVAVDTDAAGGFVVAWGLCDQQNYYGLPAPGCEVQARRFDAGGTVVDDAFRVSTPSGDGYAGGSLPTDAGYRGVDVGVADDGEFVVVWAAGGIARDSGGLTYYPGSHDGSGFGVFARVFSSDGISLGEELRVNEHTTGSQAGASVAMAGSGRFIVTWEGPEPDGQGSDVFVRIFGTGERCGDGSGDGQVSATDALIALDSAVGSGACDPCLCDVDRSGGVTATDALLVLREAVGQPVTLTCSAC